MCVCVCVCVCVLWEEDQSINFFLSLSLSLCRKNHGFLLWTTVETPPSRAGNPITGSVLPAPRVWLRSLCEHTHTYTHPTSGSQERYTHTPFPRLKSAFVSLPRPQVSVVHPAPWPTSDLGIGKGQKWWILSPRAPSPLSQGPSWGPLPPEPGCSVPLHTSQGTQCPS